MVCLGFEPGTANGRHRRILLKKLFISVSFFSPPMDFRNRSERKCFILVFSKLWSFALFDPSSYFQHNFVCCCDLIWENSVDKCPWGGRNSPTTQNVFGPWWWSSGQHACLLLRRSKFESRWCSQFFPVKFLLQKTKNKQKEAGVGPLKAYLSQWSMYCVSLGWSRGTRIFCCLASSESDWQKKAESPEGKNWF